MKLPDEEDSTNTPKQDSSAYDYGYKGGLLGFELHIMDNGYQSPEEVEGVHNKVEAYLIEQTLCLCLK
jgi:hypothetical protein